MALTKVSTAVVDMSGNTGALEIAKGTTTERDAISSPTIGLLRSNTTDNTMEVYTNNSGTPGWQALKEGGNALPVLAVDYLVVAGGGGAAWGGGGAGGYRTSYGTGNINGGLTAVGTTLSLSIGSPYGVTVGTAGARGSGRYDVGGTGGSSIFSSITSLGGLGGKSNSQGGDGGAAADAGTYGFRGGINAGQAGSGGGGAGAQGTDIGVSNTGTNGGVGLQNDITVSVAGTGAFYAGGGGGGNRAGSTTGSGGNGGGGNASLYFSSVPQSGVNNTGGGGGGTTYNNAVSWNTPGLGGTGVVILRYPNIYQINFTAGASPAFQSGNATVGTDTVTTIIAGSGTITFSLTP